MKWYFKVFWLLFIIEICLTPTLILLLLSGQGDFTYFYKAPVVMSILTISFIHLFRRMKFTAINLLFVVGGVFSLIIGLSENYEQIDPKIHSALYTFLMPVPSISFGIMFARSYNLKQHFMVKNWMRFVFIILTVQILTYVYLYNSGIIKYYGFGVPVNFIAAFELANKNIFQYLFCLILALISGKRSILLLTVIVLLFSYFRIVLRPKLIHGILIIPFLLTLIFGFNYANENNYFRRFDAVLKFDLNDKRATYAATGGRWQEVEGIVDYLNKEPYKWIVGAGIGSTYVFHDIGNDIYWNKHFSHISPFGYVFLYGLVFTIALYGALVWMILKGMFTNNFYYLTFVTMILGSLFGASMFVDHKIWVFVGIVHVIINDKRKLLPISYLA